MKKRLILILLALCLLPLSAQAAEGLRGWVKGEGYQYALLGAYPYEKDGTEKPVLWRILEVRDDQALLLTEYVIDTSQVIFVTDKAVIENKTYRRISSYEESDLYVHMNTTVLDTLLGDDPIRDTLIEEPGGGKLFILNTMQFLNPDYGFSATRWNEQRSRWAGGTPYARERGLYMENSQQSTYWVSDIKSADGNMMQLVGYNGHLSYGGYARTNVGIRPSVRLDLTRLTVTGGEGTKDSPFTFAYAAPASEPTQEPAEEAAAEPVEEPAEAPEAEDEAEAEPAMEAVTTVVPPMAAQEEATGETAETPMEEPTEAPTKEPTPESTPEPTPEPTDDGLITLSFVGDCSIGDSYQFKGYGSSYHAMLKENGYAWPFSLVKEYLEADDLTLANLEVAFTTATRHKDKMYNLVADPEHVQVLLEGSVEVVNTVNNHALDFYNVGYQDTLDTLDAAGVAHFGTVNPTQEDGFDDVIIQEVDGVRIGFIGYTYPQIEQELKRRIIPGIQQLKEEEGCDLVVISLHWGKETSMKPVNSQYNCAKAMIEAGADVIWGHHPHVIQPIEFYDNKPIMYSTGNFTFGTMSQVDPSTGIFQLSYEKTEEGVQLKRMRVIPCRTQGSPDYRPYELTEEADRQAVFKKLTHKRVAKGFENPPESFLETGVVAFENGQMLP